MGVLSSASPPKVHGDIRHLENLFHTRQYFAKVHGDIRHLEIDHRLPVNHQHVHGDIRHLENIKVRSG